MEENKEVLKEALKELVIRLNKAEDFVIEQMPQICQQIIARKTAEEKFDLVTSSLISVLSLLASIGLITYCYHLANLPAEECNYSCGHTGTTILAGVGALVTGIFFLCSLGGAIESKKRLLLLKIAPKLYVLEKLSDLI